MQTPSTPESVPTAGRWIARIVTGLVALFLAFDGIAKIVEAPQVVKASAGLGLPADTIVPIGILLLVCTTIYVIRRTAVLGAILLTGYLGGAVAIQIRAGGGAFPVIFSASFGVLAWIGLILREPRLLRLVVRRQW